MVVFGQIASLCSNWFYLGKMVVFGQKVVLFSKNDSFWAN